MQLSAIDDICAREMLDALPPVMWFMRRTMRAFRKGLSVAQFRALVFVETRPHANVSAVADHLGASMPTTSRVIAGLVRRGLMLRVGCRDDRRQLALTLSARGQSVLKSAWDGSARVMTIELAALDASQRKTIIAAMNALKSVFGSVHRGSAPCVKASANGRAKTSTANGSARRRRALARM